MGGPGGPQGRLAGGGGVVVVFGVFVSPSVLLCTCKSYFCMFSFLTSCVLSTLRAKSELLYCCAMGMTSLTLGV